MQSTTFQKLRDFAIRRFSDRRDSKAVAQVEEAIKDALDNLAQAKDWNHLISRTRITTEPEYTTGGVNIDKGATSLIATSLAATGDASDMSELSSLHTVKLNGEDVNYDVDGSASITATALTLAAPYVGTDDLSRAPFKAFKRSYDLPEDFLKLLKIVDVRRSAHRLLRINYDQMLHWHQRRSNGGTPTHYSIENKTGDARNQLWLYPYPSGSTLFQYDLTYKRRPDQPSGDSAIIDWPDDKMNLLRAAIEVELSLKSEDFNVSGLAETNFARKLADASKSDVQEIDQFYVGYPAGRGRRELYPIDPTDLNASEGGS